MLTRALARIRVALTHLRCGYVPLACSDGWWCGGCKRGWGLDGRPDR